MKKFCEFFESDAGLMSMARLLMFGSFVITSVIMIKLTATAGMSEGYFSMYLGAYAGVYLAGKGIDAKVAKDAANAKAGLTT
jgi:hypothetical protein